MLRRKDNKKQIVATRDTLSADAVIADATQSEVPGPLKFNLSYSGDSEIYWDSQETVIEKGQRIFVDEDGYETPESNVELVPDEVGT